MSAPPPYPRIPHLLPGRGTRDDVLLSPAEAERLLSHEVVVEEKLDGANVVVWVEGNHVECALRSGPGGRDRAGQLGPLRAWIAERTDQLRALLANGDALYAEWLLLTHSLAYDRLPAYLVALDILRPDGEFLLPSERDTACADGGLAVPPELYRGTPGTAETIERLLGPSTVGEGPMEGVAIRALDGRRPRIAKLLHPDFERLADRAWASGRPRNQLADREASWR